MLQCAAVLDGLLSSGALDAHLQGTLLPALQRRHGLLMGAIRRVLVPLGAEVSDDSLLASQGGAGVFGGYFVWMRFPDGPEAAAVAARCLEEEALVVAHGNLFEVHGDEDAVKFDRDIRLCFAWEDEEDLVDGVERLGSVIERMREEEKLGISRDPGVQNRRGVEEFK